MKPPIFDYLAPRSLDEALDTLGTLGDRAKVLAGGQSLVPLLNFRLVRPEYLVDINGLRELDYIREENGHVAIGALTRQRAVERSAMIASRCPLLAEALPQIGHFQIRNRGTIGGSLAHADPAAELPAVVAALDGELIVRGPSGTRTLGAREFFQGYLTTSLGADELLIGVRLPTVGPGTGSAFLEVSRRHGDFALVGVAAQVTLDASGVCRAATVALTGVGPTPIKPDAVPRLLVGQRPSEPVLEAAGQAVSGAVSPDSDIHASADYRRHVAGVLTRRALARAFERAQGATS